MFITKKGELALHLNDHPSSPTTAIYQFNFGVPDLIVETVIVPNPYDGVSQ
jgi:hypothetical protein